MERNDEGVPLLQSKSEPSRFQRKPNPLPWRQLSVVLFVETCDALAKQSIHPYIKQVRTIELVHDERRSGLICRRLQLVGGLDIIGGDERKVGYYVGLIVSHCY